MAMSGDIIDCDDKPESVICKRCSDAETCSECAQGYRLQDGKCQQCELDTCADCNDDTGSCNSCKVGFYLHSDGGCRPCIGSCLECTSELFCTKCDSRYHKLTYPVDGWCTCDQHADWYVESEENPFSCVCYKDFLTEDQECGNCEDFFPGCTQCSRVGDSDVEGFPLAIRAQANPNAPEAKTGAFMCAGCVDDS